MRILRLVSMCCAWFSPPVTILAAANIHGRNDVYDWLVEVARTKDPFAVILAGDLLGFPAGFETPEAAPSHWPTWWSAAHRAPTYTDTFTIGLDAWAGTSRWRLWA